MPPSYRIASLTRLGVVVAAFASVALASCNRANSVPGPAPPSPSPKLITEAPHAGAFERFDGCTLEPDEWTDGDSFRVRLPDHRLATFRLYFVDTIESRSRGKRSDDQAAYFAYTRKQAVALGRVAKAFTAHAIEKPFTIQTRWRPVFGPQRYYAFVYTADGEDLAELLRKEWTRTHLRDASTSARRQRLATIPFASVWHSSVTTITRTRATT